MSNTNTGGAAFPIEGFNGWGEPEQGMTLRDYFAAKAMQGITSGELEELVTYHEVASVAYQYADAMLKARQA